jgi:hypothetical protein
MSIIPAPQRVDIKGFWSESSPDLKKMLVRFYFKKLPGYGGLCLLSQLWLMWRYLIMAKANAGDPIIK